MGWSKTNPTGGTYTELAAQTHTANYWKITSKISWKRVGNTCVVAFRFKIGWGENGYTSYYPAAYYGCRVDPTSPDLDASAKYIGPPGVDSYSAWWYYTFTCGSACSVTTQMRTATGSDGTGGSNISGQSRSFTIPAARYTVSFNNVGGAGGPEPVIVTYGAAFPSITVPSRTGYSFNGYYDAPEGGTCYYDSEGGSRLTCALDADITLYAQWTADTCTVTLDAQGGTGGDSSVTAAYGAEMPAIAVPSRTGYSFGGYFTGTDGSGTQYYSAAGTSANNWGGTSDETLYAKWTPNTYTVSFDARGGTACGSKTVTFGAAYGELPAPTRANYTFAGWYTAATGGTQVTSATTVSVAADQELFAHWTLNAVVITYHGNGAGAANVPAAQEKPIGDTAVISAAVPSRQGYSFLEWNTAANGSGTSYSGGDTYAADAPLDLYAQWAAIPAVSDTSAVRCNSAGVTTDTEDDTYAAFGFNWATAAAVTGASYTIRWVNREDPTNAGSASGTLSGTYGTVSGVVCGAASGSASAFETASQYDVTITVTDSNGGAGSAGDFVSRAYYVLDFTPGGLGIGLGAPATDGRITTGLPHTADAEERGAYYEQIINATELHTLRTLDWDGSETLRGDLTAGGEIEDGTGNVLSEKSDLGHIHDDRYYTEAEVDALIGGIQPGGSIAVGSVAMPLNWTDSGSGWWYETVTVTGAAVGAGSKVDLQATAAQLIALARAGVASIHIENSSGTLTAYAVGAAPTAAMVVQAIVSDVDSGGAAVVGDAMVVPELPYRPGDTYSISGNLTSLSGLITDSQKNLQFGLLLPKSLAGITTASVTTLVGAVRGISGYVASSTNDYDWVAASAWTVSAVITGKYSLEIMLQRSSSLSSPTNNTPLSLAIRRLVIEFS